MLGFELGFLLVFKLGFLLGLLLSFELGVELGLLDGEWLGSAIGIGLQLNSEYTIEILAFPGGVEAVVMLIIVTVTLLVVPPMLSMTNDCPAIILARTSEDAHPVAFEQS